MCCSLPQKNNKIPWQNPRCEANAVEEHVGSGIHETTRTGAQTLRVTCRRDILNHYFGLEYANARPRRKFLVKASAAKAQVCGSICGGLSNEFALPCTYTFGVSCFPQTRLKGSVMNRSLESALSSPETRATVARRPLEHLRQFTVLPIHAVGNISAFRQYSAVSRRYV